MINGFAEKFAIAGPEIADGATALEIDGISVDIVHDTGKKPTPPMSPRAWAQATSSCVKSVTSK